MRLIQAMIPVGKHTEVEAMLKQQDLFYSLLEESSSENFSHVALIPVDTGRVEEIIDLLKENGLKKDGTIVVSEAQAIVSEEFDRQQENQEENDQTDPERIAEEELISKAKGLSRSSTNYLLFTIISAVVATAGLLADSASVVVGSMVIAPLIGPAMAACVGSVINDPELFREGLYSQILGTAVAILSATAFALVTRFHIGAELNLLLFDQVAERVHPGLLSLAVALGAGTAGALALTSGMSAALVGVMIAVALIPPAATVGLGLAYLEPQIATSAFILVVLNLLCINLAALVTLWFKGYRPDSPFEEKLSRFLNVRRALVLFAGVLVITGLLVVTTVQERANRQLEHSVHRFMTQQSHPLHDFEVEYRLSWLSQEPTRVLVRTGPVEEGFPGEFQQYLTEQTGLDLPVLVIEETRREVVPAED